MHAHLTEGGAFRTEREREVDENKERDWRDIAELVDWAESHLQDIRVETEYVRRLMNESDPPVEPPAENLKEAVSHLYKAKDQVVYALNSVSSRSWYGEQE